MAALKLPYTFYHIIVLIIILFINCGSVYCVDFNQQYTGVIFSPYVRYEINQTFPNKTQFSLESIKTMLSIVATKFSKVVTNGAVAEPVPYRRNVTYYNSKRDIYSAEAAALLNRDRNERSVTVLVGIWLFENIQQMITEVRLALESAEKANEIYPGTAEGLAFRGHNIFTKIYEAQQILQTIRTFRKEADQLGLKIGIRYQTCSDLLTDEREERMNILKRKILRGIEFLICERIPHNHSLGPVDRFDNVRNHLLKVRKHLNTNYSNLEVMGLTQWSNNGLNTQESMENQVKYWTTVNKFASSQNFTMWLVEAFDNPWRIGKAHNGWWKLGRNSEAHLRHAYIEKISGQNMEPSPTTEQTSSTTDHVSETTVDTSTTNETKQSLISDKHESQAYMWVYIGSGIALGIILLLISIITILCLRVKRLTEVLTKADIEEFRVGSCCEKWKSQKEKHFAVEAAAKSPYDSSYEFSKDVLKIHDNVLLGTGQFGCVFKATLAKEDKAIEVALKMAKKDCPRSALRGLLSEIKILIYLGKHENIVCIQGAYTAELLSGVVYIATELCTMGSLEIHLRRNPQRTANFIPHKTIQNTYSPAVSETTFGDTSQQEIMLSELIRWSYEIACGMEYLGSKHVIHADLATRNVLLTSDKRAKLTDFGLSRRMYNYSNYVKKQQEPLPWRWMSIEALKRLDFSSMSDVWSYGVTLWEIFSGGDIPYPGLSWDLEFVEKLVNGMRMKCPSHASNEIYKIMLDCWEAEPNSRPTFSDLKLSFVNLKDKFDQNYIHLLE